SRHLPRSPEIEYLDCVRSNATPRFSRMRASRDPCRKSPTTRTRDSEVTPELLLMEEVVSVTCEQTNSTWCVIIMLPPESFRIQQHRINVNHEQYYFEHYGLTKQDQQRHLA